MTHKGLSHQSIDAFLINLGFPLNLKWIWFKVAVYFVRGRCPRADLKKIHPQINITYNVDRASKKSKISTSKYFRAQPRNILLLNHFIAE